MTLVTIRETSLVRADVRLSIGDAINTHVERGSSGIRFLHRDGNSDCNEQHQSSRMVIKVAVAVYHLSF